MKLKQACSIYGDYGLNISTDHYIDEGIPLIRTSDCDDYGRLSLDEVKCIPMQFSKGKLLKRGDLLFSRSGTIGRCIFIDCDLEATYAGYLVRFRPDKKCLLSKYAFYWAQSSHYWSQVRENTIESTIGNFNGGKFSSLTIPECELKAQKEIADFLDRETDRIDQLIEKKKKLISLSKEKLEAYLSHKICELNLPKTKLGYYVSKIGSGKTPYGGAEVYQKSGIAFLRSQNIYNDSIRCDDVAYISVDIDNKMSASRVKEKDILLNITGGSLGRCAIAGKNILPANVNQHVCIIRPLSTVIPEFLHLVIMSRNVQDQIRLESFSANREGLNFQEIRNLLVEIPTDILMQEKFVMDYLHIKSKMDEIASLTSATISKLKEFRISLITEAVTGQLDIKSWKKRGNTDKRLDSIEEEMRT